MLPVFACLSLSLTIPAVPKLTALCKMRVYLAHAVEQVVHVSAMFVRCCDDWDFCLAQMTNCSRWGFDATGMYWPAINSSLFTCNTGNANIVQLYRQMCSHTYVHSQVEACVCVCSSYALTSPKTLVLVMKWQIKVAYAWFRPTTITLQN